MFQGYSIALENINLQCIKEELLKLETEELSNADSRQNAYQYLHKVCQGLQQTNRFFVDEEFLSQLKTIFELHKDICPTRKKLYRARVFSREEFHPEKIGTQYEGFDAEQSFVNKNAKWASFGRMNPAGITVLYAASDISTAVSELHPYFGSMYSVATIKILQPLQIVDLSQSVSYCTSMFLSSLSLEIQELLSHGSNEIDYILPQYISSYCKHLGYDGLVYRSKYVSRTTAQSKKGLNFVIFNYNKCEVINSKLYEVDKLSIRLRKTK